MALLNLGLLTQVTGMVAAELLQVLETRIDRVTFNLRSLDNSVLSPPPPQVLVDISGFKVRALDKFSE